MKQMRDPPVFLPHSTSAGGPRILIVHFFYIYSYGFSKRWIKQLLPGGYLPSELRGALWSGSPRSAEDNRRNCLFQLAG